jgi:hypothetical protein
MYSYIAPEHFKFKTMLSDVNLIFNKQNEYLHACAYMEMRE